MASAVNRLRLHGPALLLGLGAALLGAQPAWLHAKAALAQHLLERAWSARASDGSIAAPWPGADMRPVARLQLPGQQQDMIVLAGDSGRSLAFGPGWAEASTAPGSHGTVVISAHRDTHFAVLRHVRPGDLVRLESAAASRDYRIVATEVVDSREVRIALDQRDQLLLVTCWPFDAPTAGGPLRFVATAVPVDPAPPQPM